MELFQRLLNRVGQGYKEADKRLGGFLPGGGTGNVLSPVLKTVNPQDVIGLGITSAIRPAQTLLGEKLVPVATQGGSWKINQKVLPRLMSAASAEMNKLGKPNVWSYAFPDTMDTPRYSFSDYMEDVEAGREPRFQQRPKGVEVDSNKGGYYEITGPHYEVEGDVVRVGRKTPAWITAHELGHAIDFHKNPNAFAYLKNMQSPEGFEKLAKQQAVQALSPGALVTGIASFKGDQDKNLFEAGVEGALSGLGAAQKTLRAEIQADRYGMPLAKRAGINWNHLQNLGAKGSYVLGAAGPGFMQGVASELLGRNVDAISGLASTAMRALKGPQLSPTEQALVQYGYDPSKYGMSMSGDEIKIKGRNKAEQAIYNYITNSK
jgi:hypothetical protein